MKFTYPYIFKNVIARPTVHAYNEVHLTNIPGKLGRTVSHVCVTNLKQLPTVKLTERQEGHDCDVKSSLDCLIIWFNQRMLWKTGPNSFGKRTGSKASTMKPTQLNTLKLSDYSSQKSSQTRQAAKRCLRSHAVEVRLKIRFVVFMCLILATGI